MRAVTSSRSRRATRAAAADPTVLIGRFRRTRSRHSDCSRRSPRRSVCSPRASRIRRHRTAAPSLRSWFEAGTSACSRASNLDRYTSRAYRHRRRSQAGRPRSELRRAAPSGETRSRRCCRCWGCRLRTRRAPARAGRRQQKRSFERTGRPPLERSASTSRHPTPRCRSSSRRPCDHRTEPRAHDLDRTRASDRCAHGETRRWA